MCRINLGDSRLQIIEGNIATSLPANGDGNANKCLLISSLQTPIDMPLENDNLPLPLIDKLVHPSLEILERSKLKSDLSVMKEDKLAQSFSGEILKAERNYNPEHDTSANLHSPVTGDDPVIATFNNLRQTNAYEELLLSATPQLQYRSTAFTRRLTENVFDSRKAQEPLRWLHAATVDDRASMSNHNSPLPLSNNKSLLGDLIDLSSSPIGHEQYLQTPIKLDLQQVDNVDLSMNRTPYSPINNASYHGVVSNMTSSGKLHGLLHDNNLLMKEQIEPASSSSPLRTDNSEKYRATEKLPFLNNNTSVLKRKDLSENLIIASRSDNFTTVTDRNIGVSVTSSFISNISPTFVSNNSFIAGGSLIQKTEAIFRPITTAAEELITNIHLPTDSDSECGSDGTDAKLLELHHGSFKETPIRTPHAKTRHETPISKESPICVRGNTQMLSQSEKIKTPADTEDILSRLKQLRGLPVTSAIGGNQNLGELKSSFSSVSFTAEENNSTTNLQAFSLDWQDDPLTPANSPIGK